MSRASVGELSDDHSSDEAFRSTGSQTPSGGVAGLTATPGGEHQSAETILGQLKNRSLPTTYEAKLRYLVAGIDRKIVGLCVFYTYSDGFVNYADLRDLYVEPSQGRRNIGSALLEAAKKAAGADGCSVLFALPPPGDAAATRFLDKNGLCPGEHSPYIVFLA